MRGDKWGSDQGTHQHATQQQQAIRDRGRTIRDGGTEQGGDGRGTDPNDHAAMPHQGALQLDISSHSEEEDGDLAQPAAAGPPPGESAPPASPSSARNPLTSQQPSGIVSQGSG